MPLAKVGIALHIVGCNLQVTHHELNQMRQEEEAARDAEARERALAAKREVSADSYVRLVDTQNVNRQEDTVEARSMEQAIDALSTLSVAADSGAAADKHPEKYVETGTCTHVVRKHHKLGGAPAHVSAVA